LVPFSPLPVKGSIEERERKIWTMIRIETRRDEEWTEKTETNWLHFVANSLISFLFMYNPAPVPFHSSSKGRTKDV
jgi:hypothetical protein